MSLTRHVSFPNGVQGVVVSEVSKDTAMKDLFVDIGAQDKADAETMAQIGDVCVYANDCFQLGANRVASPAMDDRAACALLIRFLQTVGATKQTIIAVSPCRRKSAAAARRWRRSRKRRTRASPLT